MRETIEAVSDPGSFGTEFHRPGPCSPVTWRGRIYFLTDVSELQPEVLEQLVAIHEARLDRRATTKAVDHWAAHWRLIPVDPVGDTWPRAVALATLEHWREYPEFLEKNIIQWHFPSHSVHFALTPKEEKDQRSARRGKRGRARYHELVRQRGSEPAPILRERRAFLRLALFQVCEWKRADLCGPSVNPDQRHMFQRLGLNGIDRSTVYEGLDRTAKMIGLRLRTQQARPERLTVPCSTRFGDSG